MKVGDSARVKVLRELRPAMFEVLNLDTNQVGRLRVKGNLKTDPLGIARNVWVLRAGNPVLYGNSFFGKFDIRPGCCEKYKRAIHLVLGSPDDLSADDVSILKGMCNRCLRRDQWDWKTTYDFLGCPSLVTLRSFVRDSVELRDTIRSGDHSKVGEFAEKYCFMLRSMLFFLSSEDGNMQIDTSVPAASFTDREWKSFSEATQRNIIIIEHSVRSISQFVLMHYFVTIETEFRRHIIEPFLSANRNVLRRMTSCDQGERKTHMVLVGMEEMTLGSIEFLGRFLCRPDNLIFSSSIKLFKEFAGNTLSKIIDLCNTISSTRVNGMALRDLRNALAHKGEFDIGKADSLPGLNSALHEVVFSGRGILSQVLDASLRGRLPTDRTAIRIAFCT